MTHTPEELAQINETAMKRLRIAQKVAAQLRAYKSLCYAVAEEVEDSGLDANRVILASEAELILEHFGECPRNAAGWSDALKANDGQKLIDEVVSFAAGLAESDITDAAEQMRIDRSEADYDRLMEDPVNFAADLMRTQLAAQALK